MNDTPPRHRALHILAVATRLGLTSFGGPVAHVGYFQREYVARLRWLGERAFADLVALCQFLPGPASSQVGIAIGGIRAGAPGAVLAWLGFTLPSAILLVAFAWGVGESGTDDEWLRGLQIVAVAVVAQAVWVLGRALAPDRERISIAVGAAILLLAWNEPWTPVVAIAAGGLVGWRLLPVAEPAKEDTTGFPGSKRLALASLAAFAALLVGLPLLGRATESQAVDVVDSFYRTGSLVFGGGHVVLPLLESEVVEPGWVSPEEFVAGYGAAQAVPGPLFTFTAYLGYVQAPEPNGVPGAAIALVAIFLPSFLLLAGTLPFWGAIRGRRDTHAALRGINAAVVGLLLAALYDPVFTSAITEPLDLAVALGAFVLLVWWRLPPWFVVVVTGLAGAAVGYWG